MIPIQCSRRSNSCSLHEYARARSRALHRYDSGHTEFRAASCTLNGKMELSVQRPHQATWNTKTRRFVTSSPRRPPICIVPAWITNLYIYTLVHATSSDSECKHTHPSRIDILPSQERTFDRSWATEFGSRMNHYTYCRLNSATWIRQTRTCLTRSRYKMSSWGPPWGSILLYRCISRI